MQFTIGILSGSDPNQLQDLHELIRMLLEAAGHQVQYDAVLRHLDGGHVFVEQNFPAMVDLLQSVRRAGGESILVATEYITGNTFNDFPWADREKVWHYGNRGYWEARFQRFLECSRYVRAVWCAVSDPAQLELYRRVLGGVPVLPLPFPHFPAFPRLKHRAKDVDVHFSGTPTPHRQAILTEVHARLVCCFTSTHMPEFLRRDYLARTKLCLNIKQTPGWPYSSPLRYWYYLNQGCLVLSEQCQVPCQLDRYVLATPGETLPEGCVQLLASGDVPRLTAQACEQFAAECPGEPVARQLLDLSFRRNS